MISYNNNCIKSASGPEGEPDVLLLFKKSKGSSGTDGILKVSRFSFLVTTNYHKLQSVGFVLKKQKKAFKQQKP